MVDELSPYLGVGRETPSMDYEAMTGELPLLDLIHYAVKISETFDAFYLNPKSPKEQAINHVMRSFLKLELPAILN